ncbi:MAG: hypothetical protein MI743_18635 [Sneathiellales bacterium]|nr:hypothetical protein [Sneathiellales bacterium]
MEQLLNFTMDAHGGLDRWNEISEIALHASIKGALFNLRGQSGLLDDVKVRIDSKRPATEYSPFTENQRTGVFEPDHVAIHSNGTVIEERFAPRQSFIGRPKMQTWDSLDALYFSGYAIWHYLTAPFLFSFPGISVLEKGNWEEGGEIWKKLVVKFPENIPTHCEEQTYYIDEAGLIRRMDYHVEIVDSSIGVAHYCYDYITVGGIMLPSRRAAYPRLEDGKHDPNIVFVGLDFESIEVS